MYCGWWVPRDRWLPFPIAFKGRLLHSSERPPHGSTHGTGRAFLGVVGSVSGCPRLAGGIYGQAACCWGIGQGTLPTLGPSMLFPAAHCPHQHQVPDAGRGQGASQRAGRPRLLLPGGSVGAHAASGKGPPGNKLLAVWLREHCMAASREGEGAGRLGQGQEVLEPQW